MQRWMWPSASPVRHQRVPAVFSNWREARGLEERNEQGWKGRLRWHVGSPGVSLCVIGEWRVFICEEREGKNTPHGLQWDFSNYLLLHIWMRWPMRGLEAGAALPPSENHLRGDFKNIPLMLQDKSLITGNYGPPISAPLCPPPFFAKALCLTRTTFILSFNRRSSLWEGSMGWSAGEGRGYYLRAESDHGRWRFTALPFMWSGSLVGSNYRPNDPNWALWWSGWTDWVTGCTALLCLCAWCCPICF